MIKGLSSSLPLTMEFNDPLSNLNLVLEGLIQKPIEDQIKECSDISHPYPSIRLEENLGWVPFLVEVYFPCRSRAYMARKQLGHYHMCKVENERPRLCISPKESISKVIGIHIVLPGLREWEGKESRVILTDRDENTLVDVYSPKGLGIYVLERSLFIYTAYEDVGVYKEGIMYAV